MKLKAQSSSVPMAARNDEPRQRQHEHGGQNQKCATETRHETATSLVVDALEEHERSEERDGGDHRLRRHDHLYREKERETNGSHDRRTLQERREEDEGKRE